jgi:hypothetical protein
MKRILLVLGVMSMLVTPNFVMAQDTILTKSGCLNLLPLQTAGAVSVQDVRDCIVSIWADIETLESAPSGGGGGDSISINGTGVVDPNFVSTGNVTFTNSSNTISANIGTDSIGEVELDETMNFTGTGEFNFGNGGLEIENGTARPSCTTGQIFLDTDAPSGQQLYACEGSVFVKQGDGSGTGMSNLSDDVTPQLGGPLDAQGEVISDATLKAYSETTASASISSNILTIDVSQGNLQFASLTANANQIDFVNVPTGVITTITLFIEQTSSNPKTLALTVLEINSVSVTDEWANSTPPTMSSSNNDMDVFTFVLDPASSRIVCFTGGQNFG